MVAIVGSGLYILSRTISLPIVGLQEDIRTIDVLSKVLQIGIVAGPVYLLKQNIFDERLGYDSGLCSVAKCFFSYTAGEVYPESCNAESTDQTISQDVIPLAHSSNSNNYLSLESNLEDHIIIIKIVNLLVAN